MLDKFIEDKAQEFIYLYREIETEILLNLIEMLKQGITPTGEYQLEQLLKIKSLDRETLLSIQKITGNNMKDLIDILNEIGIMSIDVPLFTKAFEKGLLKDINNVDIANHIDNVTDITDKLMRSVQTKAQEEAFKGFRQVVNKMVIKTNAGLETPHEAMVKAVKELNKQGIRSATYMTKNQEVHHQLESVMTRVIRTEMIRVSNEVSHEVGLEIGVDTWITTQHMGARDKGTGYENHAEWQGLVVTTDELYSKLGYGEITGLGGINCRHRHYAYIDGVSVKPEPQIDLQENAKLYALQQKQRRMERSIRETKREIYALEKFKDIEGFDIEISKSKEILKRKQAQIREFVKVNNLKRNSQNERVVR